MSQSPHGWGPPPPHPPAPQPQKPLHRQLKFWLVVTAVWFGTFSCAAVMTDAENAGSQKVAAPVPKVTATTTATVTAEPTAKPTPTVTKTKKVRVEVTETKTVAPGSGGGGDPKPPARGGGSGGGGGSSTYYENCADARAHGATPVRRGDPGYGRHLDRDGDGVGCDWG